MRNDGRRSGAITIEHAPNQRDLHRFELVDDRGNVLETSAGFTETDGNPALRQFLAALEGHDWQVTKTPKTSVGEEWFDYALTDFGGGTRVVPGPQGRGTPVTKLWIATLVMIVVLFLICVVLAFTSQIEIRPA